MEKTIGKTLFEMRRKAGLTQDALAVKLGVTPQAVSKWENDMACPDIMLLPKIAALYGVSVDDLFSSGETAEVTACEKEPAAEVPGKFLNVYVESVRNDNVKVSLPISIIKTLCEVSKDIIPQFGIDISNVDFNIIIAAIENNVTGEIVNVDNENGDTVRVVIA